METHINDLEIVFVGNNVKIMEKITYVAEKVLLGKHFLFRFLYSFAYYYYAQVSTLLGLYV